MAYGYAVYFTERARNRVIRWEPDSGKAEVVAGEPADGAPDQKLHEPYGLAFDAEGYLVVADKLGERICRLKNGRLEALALRDVDGHRARRPESRRTYRPELLRGPTSVFLERTGTLLVAFSHDRTLYRIHPGGRLEHLLGIIPSRNYFLSGYREEVPQAEVVDTPLDEPTAAVGKSDGTIFFIERNAQSVREYRPGKGLRTVFPRSKLREWNGKERVPERLGIGEYHTAHPGSIALDAQEVLHVTDIQHGCILRVDEAGREVRRVHETPRPHGESGGATALAFGSDGTAWVVDAVAGAVEACRTTAKGVWMRTGLKLAAVRGEALQFRPQGSGIVTGA